MKICLGLIVDRSSVDDERNVRNDKFNGTKLTSLMVFIIHSNTKDFPKERYNTYAKSCNSNLYTKYFAATYSGLLLGTMRCL